MIFAFVEDGTLEVHEDLALVQRAYGGVDVENECVHFYSELGLYLQPEFTTPNRKGKVFGLFGWVISDVFKLVPNVEAKHDSFALSLYQTNLLTPNRWFANIKQLKSEL